MIEESSEAKQKFGHTASRRLLGPISCWALMFAGMGSSVYYFPEIFFSTTHLSPGYFGILILPVFLLLTLKYKEVTYRFPRGGGAAEIAAQTLNRWAGALASILLLISYVLAITINTVFALKYLGTIFPVNEFPFVTNALLFAIIFALFLLNWIGNVINIARLALLGAVVAFVSNIGILLTIFTHISISEFLSLFSQTFVNKSLTPASILIGFAGSFLAISGMESMSSLSNSMKSPRRTVTGVAFLLVVFTIGLTSPLLTVFSTNLLPETLKEPSQSAPIISLLAGLWGGRFLQVEVSISAGALLVFANNTAVISASNVIATVTRMEFLPNFLLRRNKLRGTQHNSIVLITGVAILIILIEQKNVLALGSAYIFSSLGAFVFTCIGLDVLRYRERRAARLLAAQLVERDAIFLGPPLNASFDSKKSLYGSIQAEDFATTILGFPLLLPYVLSDQSSAIPQVAKKLVKTVQGTREIVQTEDNNKSTPNGLTSDLIAQLAIPEIGVYTWRQRLGYFWHTLDFWLGVLTTFLVVLAWCTNLVAKPLAAAFVVTITLIGMGVAFFNYRLSNQQGRLPLVAITGVEGRIPGSVLAVLTSQNGHNDAIIRTAIDIADGKTVVFLYLGKLKEERAPRLFEVIDPYLDDLKAREYFGKAESLAQKAKIQRRFVYRQEQPDTISRVWHVVHPHEVIILADQVASLTNVNPDRMRHDITSYGKITHLIKDW